MHPQRIEQFASEMIPSSAAGASADRRSKSPPPHSCDSLRIVAGQRVDVRQSALARVADLAEMRLHTRRDAVAARYGVAAETLDVRFACRGDIDFPRQL